MAHLPPKAASPVSELHGALMRDVASAAHVYRASKGNIGMALCDDLQNIERTSAESLTPMRIVVSASEAQSQGVEERRDPLSGEERFLDAEGSPGEASELPLLRRASAERVAFWNS